MTKQVRQRTSGRPFWDEQLAKKDTMIRAQAEEILRLKATIEWMQALKSLPKGVKAYSLSQLTPEDLHNVIKKATGE